MIECEAMLKSVKLEIEDQVNRSCQPLMKFIWRQQLKVQDLEDQLLKASRPEASAAEVVEKQRCEQLEKRIKVYEIQIEGLSSNFKNLIQVSGGSFLLSYVLRQTQSKLEIY